MRRRDLIALLGGYGPASATAHQVRTAHQPQDCESHRAFNLSLISLTGGHGSRIAKCPPVTQTGHVKCPR